MDPNAATRRHRLTPAAMQPAPAPMRWMAAHKAMVRQTTKHRPPTPEHFARAHGANEPRVRAIGREAPRES